MKDDGERPGEVVTCQVCGADVGRGPGGIGVISHAGRHRRQFKELFGRPPENYQEVREKLRIRDGPGRQLSLVAAADRRAWKARNDDRQETLGDAEGGE